MKKKKKLKSLKRGENLCKDAAWNVFLNFHFCCTKICESFLKRLSDEEETEREQMTENQQKLNSAHEKVPRAALQIRKAHEISIDKDRS